MDEIEVLTYDEVSQRVQEKFRNKNVTLSNLERYEEKIKELYYQEGFGVSRIAHVFGLEKKGATEKIAMEILGYEDWQTYHKEHRRIHAKVRSRKRQNSGFTEALKEKVKEGDNHTCQSCGSHENLEVHHRDGDYRNNSMDNLITLCKRCHSPIHHPRRLREIKRQQSTIKTQPLDIEAWEEDYDLYERDYETWKDIQERERKKRREREEQRERKLAKKESKWEKMSYEERKEFAQDLVKELKEMRDNK